MSYSSKDIRKPVPSLLGEAGKGLLFLLFPLLVLASCRSSEEADDSRHDWQERNALWFAEKYDSARVAIAEARAAYPSGDEWQQHCEWRIFRTLLKSQDVDGPATDHVVCKIIKSGDGDWSAAYTDSVRLYYRGWIMDDDYPASKTNMTVFSQTYYGDFNETTAAPVAFATSSVVEGFMTALQYMVKGDDWLIYVPQELGYKETSSSAIPAYSTLLYRVKIELVHKSGTGMSEWR